MPRKKPRILVPGFEPNYLRVKSLRRNQDCEGSRLLQLGPIILVGEDIALVGELRYAVGGAFYSQLFHSMSQRIWMHTESLRSAICTFNHAASLLQHRADMGSFNVFQRFK